MDQTTQRHIPQDRSHNILRREVLIARIQQAHACPRQKPLQYLRLAVHFADKPKESAVTTIQVLSVTKLTNAMEVTLTRNTCSKVIRLRAGRQRFCSRKGK